jgi:hypothetical protein
MAIFLQDSNGEYRSLADWARKLDIPYSTFYSRWQNRDKISRARLLRPKQPADEPHIPVSSKRRPRPTEPRAKKLYAAWANLKQRITNPFDPKYKHWGGAGLEMHQEWLDDFHAFASAVGLPPTTRSYLTRIDPEGHVVPGNLEWVTPPLETAEDGNYTRSLKQWALHTGISLNTLKSRLKRGWTGSKLISPPRRRG